MAPWGRRAWTGFWTVLGFAAVLAAYPLLLLVLGGADVFGSIWLVVFGGLMVLALVAAFGMVRAVKLRRKAA